MGLSNTQINSLRQHHWPGNIRELKNVIERAVILSKNSRLRLDLAMPDLPNKNNNSTNKSDAEHTLVDNSADEFLTDAQFRDLEKINLEKALRYTNGKIAGKEGAAELLGLKPSTLTYRMQSFGIER